MSHAVNRDQTLQITRSLPANVECGIMSRCTQFRCLFVFIRIICVPWVLSEDIKSLDDLMIPEGPGTSSSQCGLCVCTYKPPSSLKAVCSGLNITKIPQDLPANVTFMVFEECPSLTRIPQSALSCMRQLKKLTFFSCGLTTIPNLSQIRSQNELSITIQGSRISVIEPYAFGDVNVFTIHIEGNSLRRIENHAFSGSVIYDIDLHQNPNLHFLGEYAFENVSGLHSLTLSRTSIVRLPSAGLENLEELVIERTYTLRSLPSVIHFSKMKRARLTFASHCCAFKNPEKQNEHEFRMFMNKQAKLYRNCKSDTIVDPPGIIWNDVAHTAIPTVVIPPPNCSDNRHVFPGFKLDCTPQPNEFNPCEDVMGYEWLRVFVWFVVLISLLANLFVLFVMIAHRSKINVSKFLMSNLAFADFNMGVYLLMLACIDIRTLGEYFNFAIGWQYKGGCQAAGFITVFASELSIFTLTVITLERWYAISHAIHLTKRLKMSQATILMIFGWFFALTMAILPLFGISDYGSTSMCLPFKTETPLDNAYVAGLLVINGIAFCIIAMCYISMYWQVRGNNTTARSSDATIAKRMALLVLTNFACWAPIAFFALTAMRGLLLINIRNSKILLVFFYPLNSMTNPFLYAIFTKQFRKDLFDITGQRCKRRTAAQRDHSQSGAPLRISTVGRGSTSGQQSNTFPVRHSSDGSVLTQYTDTKLATNLTVTTKQVQQASPKGTPKMAHKILPVNNQNIPPFSIALESFIGNRKLSVVPETGSDKENSSDQEEMKCFLATKTHSQTNTELEMLRRDTPINGVLMVWT
ncbi:follicle-stimulating hormone receptor-like [Tubulanus polymorphus]|uniref:follicle-stimulating hormone receptor-like n=1 Tax=Tubulanus polymorphus TaxID=672921 RepID=UPI003DA586C3